MIELWIDSDYEQDVKSCNYRFSYDEEHGAYRVIIDGVDELYWLIDQTWETIAEHFGFQPESVIYCA